MTNTSRPTPLNLVQTAADPDEAPGGRRASPARTPSRLEPSVSAGGFCYVRRNVRKCSQVDSHTGYV